MYTVKGKISFWDNFCDHFCSCDFSRSGGLFYDVVPFLQGGDPFKNSQSKKIIITPYALHITEKSSSNYILSMSPSYKKIMKKFNRRPVEISSEDFRSDYGVILPPLPEIPVPAAPITETENSVVEEPPVATNLKTCRPRLYRPTAVKSIIDPNFYEEELEPMYYYVSEDL